MSLSYKCVNTSRKPCDIFRSRVQRELIKETERMDNTQIYPKSWEDVAREIHQERYEYFGDRDWDEYKDCAEEQQCLLNNVGYALYGPPDEEPSLNNFFIGYSTDKLNHIKDILNMIIKHDVHREKDKNNILIGVCFVLMKIDIGEHFHIPTVIFRVSKEGKDDGSRNIFIDSDCRVYMGWRDFLNNNTLPDCTYCYPRNGIYYGDAEDKVYVDFGKTPAGQVGRKVLNAVDIGGTVVSVGGTIVGLASLAAVPVAAPLLLASAIGGALVGAYGAGRSVAKIVDRKIHDQSIGLKDSEARNCWLSLGANSAGVIAAGATRTAAVLARNGNIIGKTGQFAINAVQIGSMTINGTNIVNTFFILRDKSKSDSLSYLDIFQFTSSILFFTNSVVSMQTAETIIRENQKSVLQDFEANLRSNRHRKAYARVARNTRRGLDEMHGDAKVIKGITNIQNPDDFFSGVVRAQKQYSQNNAEVSFSNCGQVEINNHLVVDPLSFADMNKAQRQVILDASKQFSAGVITKLEYEAAVNPILHHHGLFASGNGAIPVTSICKAFGTKSLSEVKVGGRSILSNMDGRNVEILVKILLKVMSPKILQAATQLAQKFEFQTTAKFLQFLEFCNDFIQKLLMEMEAIYLETLNVARSWANFDQDQFDRDNGIEGNRQQHFINLISRMYSFGKMLTELRERYEEYCRSHRYDNGGESSNNSH